MRIEIQIGSEDPKIFPLKESKLIIGSGDGVHIKLPATEGISRKHIQISSDQDQYFVTDLGSANGSFMNEERLVPGTKKEFTSFFPVRLGDSILISLLGDDEPMPEKSSLQEVLKPKEADSQRKDSQEKTQILSRKALGPNQKSSLAPQKAGGKKAPVQTKKKSSVNWNYLVALLLILGAATYQFLLKPTPEVTKSPEELAPPSTQQTSPTPNEEKLGPKTPTPVPLSANEIPELEKFALYLNDIKCATTLEKKLCELIPNAQENGNGVLESIDKLVIILPEESWFNESLLSFPSENIPPSLKLSPLDRTTLIGLYALKSLPPFPWKDIEKNLFLLLYVTQDGVRTPSTIIGLKTQNLEFLLSLINEKLPKLSVQDRGKTQLPPFRDYFSVVKNSSLAPEENP
jgi:pSer/pThr/pTyr-binding forkhead associated (FHA) protein